MRYFPFLLLLLVPDLDVDLPPGSPLDWRAMIADPVPSPGNGFPVPSDYGRKGGTGTEAEFPPGPVDVPVRPRLEFVHFDSKEYYGGTSTDYAGHLQWATPTKPKANVTQDSLGPDTWNYPPAYPAEVTLQGTMAVLREALHQRAISWPEAAAYILELGEPAIEGAKVGSGEINRYFKPMHRPLPKSPPKIPRHKDPKQAVLFKLAAVELTSGFPHALDPTFARRIRMLGEETEEAVLACSKSAHTLLARNAVTLLTKKEDLIEIWKDSTDQIVRARALRGLMRLRAKEIVPDLSTEVNLGAGDLPRKVMAIYALGEIGDPAGAKNVAPLLAGRDPVLIWTAVPALGKMKAGKKELLKLEKEMQRRTGGRDDCNVKSPQPDRLLRQKCAIALAMIGEDRFVKELRIRVKRFGLKSYHPVTHYDVITALTQTPEGNELAKKVAPNSAALGIHVVNRVDWTGDELQDLVYDAKQPAVVRARAIQRLLDVDGPTARIVCDKLLSDFLRTRRIIDAGTAVLVQVAAQVGGLVDAFDTETLVKAVDRAYRGKLHGKREGLNDTNLANLKVRLFPRLLETLIVELGRKKDEEARPVLIRVLKGKGRGRSEAVLALAAIPDKESVNLLVKSLQDRDGWVRYCAWKSLVQISAQDHFAGWIWVTDRKLAKDCIARYQTWAKREFP